MNDLITYEEEAHITNWRVFNNLIYRNTVTGYNKIDYCDSWVTKGAISSIHIISGFQTKLLMVDMQSSFITDCLVACPVHDS